MQGQIAIGAISNGFLLRPYFGDWNAAYNFSWWNCFITFTPDSWIFATAFSRTVERKKKKKKKVRKSIAIETRAYTCSKVIARYSRFLMILYLSVCLQTFLRQHLNTVDAYEKHVYIYIYIHTKRLKCNRLPLPLPFRVFASNNKYQDRYFLPRFMKTLAKEYFVHIAYEKREEKKKEKEHVSYGNIGCKRAIEIGEETIGLARCEW